MEPAWRDVAVFGTAAVTGLLSGLPTGEAANCLKILLDGRAPNFKKLVGKAEQALGSFIAHDLGGEAGFAPLRANVEELLKQQGWSGALAVSADLDPERLALAALPNHHPLFSDELKGKEPLARGIIACVYRAVLDDSTQLNNILPEVFSELLKMRGILAGLPDATAAAFIELQTRLLLTPGTRILTDAKPTASWLLRPDYAIVPFDPAREPAAADLLAWCEGGPQRAVRLLHGPGGFGKSRLLIEVAHRLCRQGWHAGFLVRGETVPPNGTYERLCAGERPVCIVVDYAETRRDEVIRVLRRVRNGTAPRLRVVLLARAPGEWWPALARADADVQELLGANADVQSLPPVPDDAGTRRAAFDAAATAFARRLDLAAAEPAAPDLTAPAFGRFLFVHIAALAAIQGVRLDDADALLAWVLDREERHWRIGLEEARLAPDRFRDLVAQAVTLATLAGTLRTMAELEALIASAPLAHKVAPLELRDLRKLLARLYPDSGGLGALRPDLLGEELVARELDDNVALLDVALAATVPAERLESTLTVLTRLARREPEQVHLLRSALTGRVGHLAGRAAGVAIETDGPLGSVLADAVLAEPPADPRPLENLLPLQTVALRGLRVVVGTQIQDFLKRSSDLGSEASRAEYARITSNLSVYLAELGRRETALAAAEEEAVAAAEEAVGRRRELAAARPDAFRPDLATSLGALGRCLEADGRVAEAASAAQEGMAVLAPAFLALPQAFAGLMTALAQDYLRLSEALGQEPDAALLGPIVETFQRLQKQASERETG